MISTTITNEQKVNATLAPKTATGKPAKLDGVPTWTVDSGDATVNVAADGLSADLISGDAAAESKITISADADLGEGIETVTQEVSLIVTLANASDLGLTIGAPQPK